MTRVINVGLVAVLWTLTGVMGVVLAAEAEAPRFRAGAARIDITPLASSPVALSGYGDRGGPSEKIHDRIYYRAIALDDGSQKAVILVGDVLAVSHAFWERIALCLEGEIGVSRSSVLLCATHTHAAPDSEYRESDEMADRLVALAKLAVDRLQPARVGAAQGYCNVNICRRARTAAGNALGGWWLGQNPDGPADKTMHVVKFESLEGRPIAILANYAAHGTTMGQANRQISGDHPGACSRLVEAHYGGDVVAAWTSGAAGDLDPIYAYREQFGGRINPVDVLGRIQGEEVIRLVETIQTHQPGKIRAARSVVAAPGRKNLSGKGFRPDGSYEFADADPVDIRLTVLQIGDIALCGVSGEVLTLVGQRFKQRSPLEQTMMITHANGDSGYLPNDEAYQHLSYELLVTQVKPGVERIVIDGLIGLLETTR